MELADFHRSDATKPDRGDVSTTLTETETEKINTEKIALTDRSELPKHPCTRWHIFVCISVFLVTLAEASVPHSYGTLMTALKESSRLTLSELSWMTVITSALPYVATPLCMAFIRPYMRFYQVLVVASFVLLFMSCLLSSFVEHYKLLFLTYSFLYGVGSCFILATCLLILADYFPAHHHRHVLATSLYQAGYPLAAAIFNPIDAALISQYSWRGAWRILGVILLVIGGSLGFLLRPRSLEELTQEELEWKASADSENYQESVDLTNTNSISGYSKQQTTQMNAAESSNRLQIPCCKCSDMRERPEIVLWFVAKLVNYVCWFALRTNFVQYMMWRGQSRQMASYIMTSYGIGEVVLGIGGALFGDRIQGYLLIVHLFAASGMAILTLLWTLVAKSYILSVVMGAFVGAFIQMSLSFGYPASAEVTQLPLRTAASITMAAGGLGMLLSPLIGGLPYDISNGNYRIFFYLEGGLWLLQVACYVAALVIIWRRDRSLKSNTTGGRAGDSPAPPINAYESLQ